MNGLPTREQARRWLAPGHSAYDPKTFRLARTRTERVEGTGEEPPYKGTGPPLQELGYRYDLAGNVLSIDDRTPGAGVEDTAHGADRLLRAFEYDALYRLTAASGRVCTNIGSPRPTGDAATCGFGGFDHGSVNQANAPKLTRRYDERYRYDAAGNMLTLAHHPAGATGWTRRFGVGGMKPADWDAVWRSHLDPNVDWPGAPGNRLTHVGDAQSHFFDEGGNMVRQLTSSHYEWDWAGRMRSFRVQARAAGSKPSEDRWAEPSPFTHYLYDSAGQRVKKLTRNKGGQFETITYIGATFEAHRFRDGKQGTTLHVLDGDRRIVSRRLGNAHPADRSPEVKYQLDDHLGSSVLVVDQGGGWVNREEYSPYGDTTFGGFGKKRYRYSGKERDEESGLYYHGARYYAPWLARWTSPDPLGLVDGPNAYLYVRGNPLRLRDGTGLQSSSATGTSGVQTQTPNDAPVSDHPFSDRLPTFALGESGTWGENLMYGHKWSMHDEWEAAESVVLSPTAWDAFVHRTNAVSQGMGLLYASGTYVLERPAVWALLALGKLTDFVGQKNIEALAAIPEPDTRMLGTSLKFAASYQLTRAAVLASRSQAYSAFVRSSFAGLAPLSEWGSKGQLANKIGAAREEYVASLERGTTLKGLGGQDYKLHIPSIPGRPITLDVVGAHGEFIAVGGPAKGGENLSKTMERLTQLKRYAEYYNTQAIAYFEQGVDTNVLRRAREILGSGNVRTFSLPAGK